MAAKPKPMSKIKQVLRAHQQGRSIKWIARSSDISRNTVRKYLQLALQTGKPFIELLALDEPSLQQILLPQQPVARDQRWLDLASQYNYFTKELQSNGVTKFLLWSEYRQKCPGGYGYSQFCWHLSQLDKAHQVRAVIDHRPGDLLYLDFTGKLAEYIDPLTGVSVAAQIFGAVLGYSQYAYVQAVPSQQTPDLVDALSLSVEWFGGVPDGVVPDNLKSAVTKADRYEPTIHQVLEDWSNHYQTTIIPARVASPRDKSLVENLVKHIYSQILAPLRHQKFYSLDQLNAGIRRQLELYNSKAFQGRDYSRKDLFQRQEKPQLKPLPEQRFRIVKRRQYKVQNNSHIFLGEDRHYYSVPHQWIGQQAMVVYTSVKVDIYVELSLVASHRRDPAPHRYTTMKDHLPSHLQAFAQRSPDYYRQRAARFGADFLGVINHLFEQARHPEQAYRSCDGLLKLARQTDPKTLAQACSQAQSLGVYTYSFLKRVIQNPLLSATVQNPMQFDLPEHENIRGKNTYN